MDDPMPSTVLFGGAARGLVLGQLSKHYKSY